jgi:hypothetical protein
MSDKKDYELTFSPQEYGITNPVLGHLLFTLYKVGAIPIKSLCQLLTHHRRSSSNPKNLSELLCSTNGKDIRSGGTATQLNQRRIIPWIPNDPLTLDDLTDAWIQQASIAKSPENAIKSIDSWSNWYTQSRETLTNYAEKIASKHTLLILTAIAEEAKVTIQDSSASDAERQAQLCTVLSERVRNFAFSYSTPRYRKRFEALLSNDKIDKKTSVEKALKNLEENYNQMIKDLPRSIQNRITNCIGRPTTPGETTRGMSLKKLYMREILSGILFFVQMTRGAMNFPPLHASCIEASGLRITRRALEDTTRTDLMGPYDAYPMTSLGGDLFMLDLYSCPAFASRIWTPINT